MKHILLGLLLLTGCSKAIAPTVLAIDLESPVTPRIQAANIGQDYLALQQKNFSVKEAIKYALPNTPVGLLDWTFGTSLEPLRSLLASSTPPSLVRVHLINAVCVRNRNCFPYEPAYGLSIQGLDTALRNKNSSVTKHLKARTKVYRDLAERFPNTKFLVSPLLEHNASSAAFRSAANSVLSVWPTVQLVNSAMECNGERYKGAYRECHGDVIKGQAEINSLDGEDATDINMPKFVKATASQVVRFIWSRVYNCRNNGPFQDPRKRTSCPKPNNFKLLSHIADVRPPAPPQGFACSTREFKAPMIWKPFADDHGTGDARANFPVLIVDMTPKKNVEVVAHNGTKVGTLAYYGGFEGKLHRWYSRYPGGSGLSGYGFEERAERQGSPWVWIKQGSRCVGPIVPGYRNGVYR